MMTPLAAAVLITIPAVAVTGAAAVRILFGPLDWARRLIRPLYAAALVTLAGMLLVAR